MTLKEIFDLCRKMDICERRDITDQFIEFVFYTKDTAQWDTLLSSMLGTAVKPAGARPSLEATSLAQRYGGVWDEQTMYKKEFGADIVVAMFWPWQDKKHTTLKMFMAKK